MTGNLRQSQATTFLCSKGADISATNTHGDTAFHKAADGIKAGRKTREVLKSELHTYAERVSVQDQMMAVLQTASGRYKPMNQPNNSGKTPQVLQMETRNKWQGIERAAFRRGGRVLPRG